MVQALHRNRVQRGPYCNRRDGTCRSGRRKHLCIRREQWKHNLAKVHGHRSLLRTHNRNRCRWQHEALLPTGGGFFWGNPPGGVFQFGLPAASQAVTTTSVATSVTTQRATIVSTQTVAGPSTGIDPGTFY